MLEFELENKVLDDAPVDGTGPNADPPSMVRSYQHPIQTRLSRRSRSTLAAWLVVMVVLLSALVPRPGLALCIGESWHWAGTANLPSARSCPCDSSPSAVESEAPASAADDEAKHRYELGPQNTALGGHSQHGACIDLHLSSLPEARDHDHDQFRSALEAALTALRSAALLGTTPSSDSWTLGALCRERPDRHRDSNLSPSQHALLTRCTVLRC